ncbi:hypothetical protein [Streptomyces sp. M2CJ-2]|nr:hypothetical protein [Streptomyces sp. M2CJ-2]
MLDAGTTVAAATGEQVVVEARTGVPAGFQGEGAEALSLDQVPE